MKPNTMVWLLCESIGRPNDTLKMHCTIREAISAQAQWIMGVYMGAKIRVTYARDEADLAPDRRSAGKHHDIMSDLELILNGSDYAHEAEIDKAEESDGHS